METKDKLSIGELVPDIAYKVTECMVGGVAQEGDLAWIAHTDLDTINIMGFGPIPLRDISQREQEQLHFMPDVRYIIETSSRTSRAFKLDDTYVNRLQTVIDRFREHRDGERLPSGSRLTIDCLIADTINWRYSIVEAGFNPDHTYFVVTQWEPSQVADGSIASVKERWTGATFLDCLKRIVISHMHSDRAGA